MIKLIIIFFKLSSPFKVLYSYFWECVLKCNGNEFIIFLRRVFGMNKIDNYKLAIISNDSVTYRGDLRGDDLHEHIMMKYGIEKYGNSSIFGVFEKELNFKLAEYYLASYGNILFYNLSGDDNKFGIFYVLNNIDEKQLKLVFDFLDTLEGFTVELDGFLEFDGELIMNDPFEESYEDGFSEIRQYFKDITIESVKKK